MQLILQPCGASDAHEHYVDTIKNVVPIERILPFLLPEERLGVQEAFPQSVAIWGVTPGQNGINARKWKRIVVGDTAMLYRQRQFFFRGTIAYKTHAPDLASELWGNKSDGSTWEYVFFLTDLEPVEIGIESFNRAAGYEPNYIVQGFNVLPEEMSEAILDALELGSGGIGASLPSVGEMDAAKKSLAEIEGALDISSSSTRRKEQAYLRTILLGRKTTEYCSICRRQLPVDLLVIGHIRKRHSCSTVMKKDLQNVMPICLLGCDSLFENGYINVDNTGTIPNFGSCWSSIPDVFGSQFIFGQPMSEVEFRFRRLLCLASRTSETICLNVLVPWRIS